MQVALILDDRATGSLDKYVLGESNITLFLLSSYFCMGWICIFAFNSTKKYKNIIIFQTDLIILVIFYLDYYDKEWITNWFFMLIILMFIKWSNSNKN